MPHFMIVLIPYINLLNFSWIIKCLFLRNMEPLSLRKIGFFRGDTSRLKGIYSKRKEFAPCGSQFFPFRADPFSERVWCARKQNRKSIKLASLLKWQNFNQLYQVPLITIEPGHNISYNIACVSCMWISMEPKRLQADSED